MIRSSLLLATALSLAPTLAQAQATRTESFYDSRGSFAGSAITRGNASSFYDARGRFDGSAIRNRDGSTSFYDARGALRRLAGATAMKTLAAQEKEKSWLRRRTL